MTIKTDGLQGVDPGLDAAREGRALVRWANNVTPGASEVVLTDTTLIYDIPIGKQVIVTQICHGLTSFSDSCVFTLVACSEPNGAGAVTDLNHDMNIASGSAIAGTQVYHYRLRPPICVKHKDGHRSISFQVTANDASATITVGWHGWYEDEA